MFKWKRRPAEQPPEPNVLLAQTIARHFEGGTVEGDVARIGLGGVEVDCTVNDIQQLGEYYAASLFFRLYGGPLGPEPIFASVSGYEKSPETSIVVGACNWACTFGPVLRAGLTGVAEAEADEFEIVLDGRRFRGVVEGLDRVMAFDGAESDGLAKQTRDRLGAEPWLVPGILESSKLPLLTAGTPTVVSVFLSEGPPGQVVEVKVKVNGSDWGPACSSTEDVGPENAMVMLRELAVLTAIEPAPALDREAVQRTLDGLADRTEPGQSAGWPGWQTHGGRLGDPLADVEVSVIEVQTGPLPADYRQFLTEVAGPGAGPGYGLSYPRWVDDSIVLAHAGCGDVWVLRLDPAEYGTVWSHAIGSDRVYQKAAGSFTEWLSNWLDAAVRDVKPWVQWDVLQCATAGVLIQATGALEKSKSKDKDGGLAGMMGENAITITSGEGYFPAGSAVDPCHGCVELAARFGLSPEVFAPGVLSRPPA